MMDALEADTTRVVRALQELRTENQRVNELVDTLEKSIAIERETNDRLRSQLEATERKLDYYLRFTTEMVTQWNTVRDIQDRVMERCKEAALKLEPAEPAQEPPRFLLEAIELFKQDNKCAPTSDATNLTKNDSLFEYSDRSTPLPDQS